MREMAFFQEVEHIEVPWGERNLWVPVFYYDIMSMSVRYLAPAERVKALLPSPRLQPLRVTPGQSVVSLTLFAYRDSDVGPYNEVSFSVPVTLDKASPLFTGILSKAPTSLGVYVRQMPVSTEIARAVGVFFAAYPKFLAEIEYDQDGEWTTFRASHEGRDILTFSGRMLETALGPRSRIQVFTHRNGYLLRSELIVSETKGGASTRGADVRLELGDHPMAQEIEGLNPGRLVGYQWAPRYQAILTPVLESLPG
jgi:hypothetical protein